jgi:integrase
VPAVRAFMARLRDDGRSPAMVKRVVGDLGSILAYAQEEGLVAQNVVRSLGRHKRRQDERRQKKRLKVGVDIPTPGEIQSIVAHLKGRWRPLLLTAIFTGLRSSELRGLRWADIDLKNGMLHVRQRADRYGTIGQPKSESGQRTVPLPPMLTNSLREWKLKYPRPFMGQRDADGDPIREAPKAEHLIFPNSSGNVENHANIRNRGLASVQVAAGVVVRARDKDDKLRKDKDGEPIMVAKYTGLHALRHFYASWCINRVEDGGLGLPPKIVQTRLGHATLAMTMDTYGHLFPSGDDGKELAAAEAKLFAT